MKHFLFHYSNNIPWLRAYGLDWSYLNEAVIICAHSRDEAWSKAIKHSEKYKVDAFSIELIDP